MDRVGFADDHAKSVKTARMAVLDYPATERGAHIDRSGICGKHSDGTLDLRGTQVDWNDFQSCPRSKKRNKPGSNQFGKLIVDR